MPAAKREGKAQIGRVSAGLKAIQPIARLGVSRRKKPEAFGLRVSSPIWPGLSGPGT